MPVPKIYAAPDPGALPGYCCPLMFCVMTRTHPWIERISDRFFEVSFDAAFRDTVWRFLERRGMTAHAFGAAVNDPMLAGRLKDRRPIRLDTADKGFGFMGEPLLRGLYLQEIEGYLQITGTKAYVLGQEAAGDRSYVKRLREGLSPYLCNIDKVRRWMGEHSTREQRRAIGAATLHASWFRLGAGGYGHGVGAASHEQRYLNAEQAAKYLGVSRKKLDRLRTDGGGPAYYKFGSSVRYRREDLDEWARPMRRLSTSDDGTADTDKE